MAKQLEFNWQRPVPDELLTGETLDRIDEDGCVLEPNCLVKVDEYGFFIYWTSEGREGQVIECSQISDIRADSPPKTNGNGGFNNNASVDPRIVCICSGLDFVNINYTYFIARADSSAERWCKNLRSITHNYKANNVCPTMQLQKHWLKLCLMVNCNGKIPVRSITRTFASGKTEKMVMQALEELGLPGGKNEEIETSQFTFEKFVALYHKICPRTDIMDLFAKISYHKDHMTASQLLDFMNNHQRDPRLNEILCPFYDLSSIVQLIRRYETNPKNLEKDPPWLSRDAFCQYLMSDENAPMFLDRLDTYQEMDHPLSHYYINSSHNTYLVGRQFGGKSSVEMYRQVLIAGCRCIELDCWDGPNNEPIITHGKAMCTDISFKEVIAAIKDTAFIASDYPVILSFENHCTKSQQEKLADYCQQQFGDMLLKECLPDIPLKPGVPLPSPNQLKRKILIKNKRLKPEVEKEQLERFYKGERSVVENTDTSDNVEGEDSLPRDVNFTTVPSEELAHPEQESNSNLVDMLVSESQFVQMKEKHDAGKDVKINMKMVGKMDSLSNDDESQIISQYQYESATTNIHPVLSSLVNYVQPVKFQNFEIAEERNFTHNMSSFNENTGLGLLRNHAIEFVNYNKRQLSRIYPKGGRVDSSNYMPQIFWNAGSQMVSLNFQTPDLAMQLNQGKFEYNGNCGYLLKPDFMRRPDREFDPFSECPVDGVIAAHCSIRVISGQFLSDKKVGTYVEVDMFGLPTDTIRRENRTKVVPNNGLNPIYNSEPFIFRKIVLPDLAVLRIGVYEESNRLIGQRILPLDGLQAGFRHISLRTEGNFPLSLPTVFCEIVLKTYIPDGLDGFVNALSDPRRFTSMADNRASQMKSMGIDEKDIADVPEYTSPSAKARSGVEKSGQPNLVNSKSVSSVYPVTNQRSIKHQGSNPNEPEFKFEAVSIDTLKQLREFTKLCKQHVKDLASLKKRHYKEKILAQKTHRSTNSAAATESANRKSLRRKGLPKSHSESEVQSLATIPELEHSPIWKSLMSRQVEEEVVLRNAHVDKQRELLQNLLSSKYHEGQLKELSTKHDREMKELSATQTKSSLLTKKQITTANDKTIKNRAEADRRMKEINESNTKKFRDERQLLQSKQNRQLARLKDCHKKELEQMLTACEEEKSSIAKEYNSEIVEKIETVI